MNQILVLLLVICLSFNVQSQDISSTKSTELKPLHPSLAVILGIIGIMLSVTFMILTYAKFCSRGNSDDDQDVQGLVRSCSRFSGVDRTVIDSLPFFRFSSLKGSKEGLECAVCLSRFEDSEILRFLPKCKHAFHSNCIDQWLESHSSCPLCRYRIDIKDLKSISCSNSFRNLSCFSNLSEDPNLEIFVEREQDHHQISSRFKNEEVLIQDGMNKNLLHKFKHKIIVSDVVIKHRWSDVNSSDFLSLNSDFLGAMASNRFPSLKSTSARFYQELSMDEKMVKIKEDIERKRLYESKITRGDRSYSCLSSSDVQSSLFDENSSKMIVNSAEKRSMSEIVMCSRFKDFKTKEFSSPRSSENEERMKRIWLPIARRTVQWFAGSEKNLLEGQEYKRQTLNV